VTTEDTAICDCCDREVSEAEVTETGLGRLLCGECWGLELLGKLARLEGG
jgi:hypothetical protein